MTDQTVTLRLTTDPRGVAPGVRLAQSEIDKLGGTAQAAGRKAQESFKGAGEQIERTARSAGTAETMLRRFLGAAAAGQALLMAGRTADAYADIVGKLRQVSSGERELATAKAATFAIAQRYYQNLDATVTLYGRATRAAQEYGYNQAQAAKLTETVAAGLLVDRAGTAESASAILQLSQALGAGALRGEEFNAVAEAAPSLMKALADSLDVPRGALKKMAEEGQLTIDVLMDAFTGDQAAMLAQKASEVPLTIGRAWQQAKNDALRYVGEADQGIGASSAVASAIALMSQNLGALVTVAATAATVFVGQLVQKGLRAAQAAWIAQSTVVNTTTASYLTHSGVVTTTTANTVRLTAAQTAAAVASRGLASALAFVQANPIMLAVTAVVLLAGAFWQASRAADEAHEKAKALQESVVLASDAYGEFAKAPTFQGIADLKAADDAHKELAASVEDAYERMTQAQESYLRTTARTGDTSESARRQVEESRAAYERQVGQLRALTEERKAADSAAANELRRLIELDKVSQQGERTLADLAQRKREGSITTRELTDRLAELATSEGNAARGAYLADNGLAVLQQRAANFSKVLQGMDSDLNSAIVNLVRLEQGQYKAWLVQKGMEINANGGLAAMSAKDRQQFNEQAAAYKRVLEQTEVAQAAAAAAKKADAAATREASKVTREYNRDKEQQADSQRRYTEEVERMQAQLQGPVRLAEVEHQQRLAEIKRELAEKNITQAAATSLEAAYEQQLKRTTAELVKQQNAPQALLDTMSGEIRLLGMIGIQRERYSRQLQNEADMRRAIADSIDAGNAALRDSPEQQAQLIANARAMADWSLAAEESARQAEEWADVWTRGIESAADAMTDFIMSGLKDFRSLASSLKSVAKQLVGDLVRTFLQQRIVVPIQTQITNSMNSGGGLGDIFQSVMGLFRGNGFSGAGQGGGNLASILSSGNGGLLSSIAGLFGGGGSAAAGSLWAQQAATGVGSLFNFGNNVAGFMGAGSAASGGSLLGGAGSAIGGAVKAIPVIGWIIAGMMKNAELFDQGWDIANGESWAGKVATLGAVGEADKMFRKLGLNDKWASILSGSSIHAKLFGRKKPKITGSGISGTYGFGGFDGSSYADIYQKGGLFRSSKRWTQWGAISGDVDKAFDAAIDGVRRGVEALAGRLGTDVGAKLANIKVNIGKIALDADPAKAQQQLEKAIDDMIENLSKQAINALGFGRLLDDGFAATEVMAALDSALTLVTGSADKMGRTLQAWEIENVSRAVEYFMDLAKKNGTSLQGEVERVTGLLGQYSGLMTGVRGELLTSGLSDQQRAALQIETTYRNQIRSANELAKALGLSGARAEDLAAIEQLRAVNMAKLQTQIEEQRSRYLDGLALSEYSPLTDTQKLEEAKRQFSAAEAAGDIDQASQAMQQALALGRNLSASGQDFNALYDELTNRFRSIKGPSLVTDDGTTMGDLADVLLDLPERFASEMFALLYKPVAPTGGGTGSGGGTTTSPPPVTGGNGQQLEAQNQTNAMLREIRDILNRQGRDRLWEETAS